MFCRSAMLERIQKALEGQSYASIREIYMFLVGYGLIKEESDDE